MHTHKTSMNTRPNECLVGIHCLLTYVCTILLYIFPVDWIFSKDKDMERSRIIEVVNKCPKPKLGEKKSSSILSLTNFCLQATAVNRRVPWIYNWKEISGSVEKCSFANQKVISLSSWICF